MLEGWNDVSHGPSRKKGGQAHKDIFDRINRIYEDDMFLSFRKKDRKISNKKKKPWDAISVRRINRPYSVQIPLHPGEGPVISLALEAGIDLVIMDDAKARTVAEIAGLKPRGTLWLLVEAIKRNRLNFDEFLAILEAITNKVSI